MKLKLKKIHVILLVLIVLITCSISFNIVQAVTANTPEPGSDKDPLVTKSYVDENLEKALQQIQQLQERCSQLERQMKSLQSGGGKTTGSSTATQDKSIGTGTVSVASVNIREKPDASSTLITSAKKGEIVTVLSGSSGWYRVKTAKGIYGWVMDKYITMKK